MKASMCIKLLTILVLLCVIKVRSASHWQGEGWVDYEYGDLHEISASSSPLNVTVESSLVRIEFFADEFDNFYFDLGDLRNFGLLSSKEIYNSGNSTVYGNYGIYSNSSSNSTSNSTLSNVPSGLVVDSKYTVEDSNSQVSENALNKAKSLLNEVSSLHCNRTFNDSEKNLLGGETLDAGMNCWEYDDLYIVGGNLLLDAGGDDDAWFVIRVNGALTVGSWGRAQTVELINGGSSCNVYWIVQGNVRIHAGSSLIGTLIAGGDIILDEDASVTGTVVSTNGDITLNDANIDNSLCGSNRNDFNVTFAIWPALTLPLDFDEGEQFFYLNDQSVGFEIVASGGGFSYMNFYIPKSSNSTQLRLLNESDYSLECWYMSPYDTETEDIAVTHNSDGSFWFSTKVGQGTFFFVMVKNEYESSSSSTGSSGGGGGHESSSGTHQESSSSSSSSSTASHVESSTSIPLPSLSSSGSSHHTSTGAH